MAYVIYADRAIDLKGNELTKQALKIKFNIPIKINQILQAKGYRTAYCFVDSLLDSFEAANHFYFDIFECTEVTKLNVYRSGCGPIQALSDAKVLVDQNLADAVFVFGHEQLATTKMLKGKEFVMEGMNIFQGVSIPAAYNKLAHRLINVLDIPKNQFLQITDQLHKNYQRSYGIKETNNTSLNRNSLLDSIDADLFTLTDCANPYIDFTGGLIVAQKEIADLLKTPPENIIGLKAAEYNVIGDGPENIERIIGEKNNVFPHLAAAYRRACQKSGIDFTKEFKAGNALMEAYTCYPPIPLGLLLAAEMIDQAEAAHDFLRKHDITITGGLNLARAPWNNPALNSAIAMCQMFRNTKKKYGMVHGNGGLGGLQGIAILEKE